MTRLEALFFGLFAACWLLAALGRAGLLGLAGALPVSLYALYTLAAALGWISGNVFMVRARGAGRRLRRRLRAVYLLGPPGLLYLLWTMAPAEAQRAAPFVPLYAWGVYAVLFLVPVLLPRPKR